MRIVKGGPVVTDRESLGKRLVWLAAQPLNKYELMCTDCILDSGCTYNTPD